MSESFCDAEASSTYLPITGELRGKMGTLGWYDDDGNIVISTSSIPHSDAACLVISSDMFDQLCDVIDNVHANLELENDELERENTDLKMQYVNANRKSIDLDHMVEDLKAEQDHEGWVRLPKDADGEYVHIGDVMESNGTNSLFGQASFEVQAIRCDEGGWEVYDRLGDRYAPSILCHHHTATVEDVLTEFARECLTYATCVDDHEVQDAIEEYAAKLRLAGDAS